MLPEVTKLRGVSDYTVVGPLRALEGSGDHDFGMLCTLEAVPGPLLSASSLGQNWAIPR